MPSVLLDTGESISMLPELEAESEQEEGNKSYIFIMENRNTFLPVLTCR